MPNGDAHPQGNLSEESLAYSAARNDGVDVSLLRVSLAMTPWERMQANDDALNFADSLRAAMAKRNAKSQ